MAWRGAGKGGQGAGLGSGSAQLPPWLVAGQQSAALSKGLVQPTWSGKGGASPSAGPGRDFPIAHIHERPIPPWLAAAQGQPMGLSSGGKGSSSATKGIGRQRLTASRIQGTLIEWNGTLGFVKPDTPIKHKDADKNKKGLFLAKADVFPPGHELEEGMQVTCFAYSDGLKLGAEKCMEFKGSFLAQDRKEKPKPSILGKAAQSGKGKAQKAAAVQGHLDCKGKGAIKGIWVWQPDFEKSDNRPAKGKGKQRNKQDGRSSTLPRTRITHGASVTGKCVEWKGTHGWIEPDEPVDHEKAAKNNGRVHIHQKDIIEVHTLYTGQVVNFHIYEDDAGIGAEECIVC